MFFSQDSPIILYSSILKTQEHMYAIFLDYTVFVSFIFYFTSYFCSLHLGPHQVWNFNTKISHHQSLPIISITGHPWNQKSVTQGKFEILGIVAYKCVLLLLIFCKKKFRELPFFVMCSIVFSFVIKKSKLHT